MASKIEKEKAIEIEIENVYWASKKIAGKHYENFPVGSLLLPRKLRKPIHVIYAFARSADDIADEGNLTAEERLAALNLYWQTLEAMEQDRLEHPLNHNRQINNPRQTQEASRISEDPLFLALQEVIEKHKLPYELFYNLLHAFKQDIIQKDYQNFDELLQYCHYSANPIGRLLLHLTDNASPENLMAADAVCTALQLINFIQDLQSDLSQRARCYFPLDEMQSFGIDKDDLLSLKNSTQISQFIYLQIFRAQEWLQKGSLLGSRLNGLFGLEIRLIISAGQHMIQQLLKRKNVYERPTIQFWHWPKIFLKAIIY